MPSCALGRNSSAVEPPWTTPCSRVADAERLLAAAQEAMTKAEQEVARLEA